MFYRIDDEGRVIERHDNQDEISKEQCIQSDILLDELTDGGGRYKYIFHAGVFMERSSAEKDNDFTPTSTPTAATLLQAQVQALSDRNEFLEDCIAEMAGVVYGNI